jgi:Asp-tRNA(Asn)/Glu-tRNA(Gln) amidotransferase A subunit family amidase
MNAPVDTNARKLPDPLPFDGWRELSPPAAAREVRARIAALSPPLRSAALAWLRPEHELARELETGRRGPLGGIPYLLKDLFDVAGAPTHAGSSFLARVRPIAQDSAIVTRLRGAGAALAGKTHLVEFAAGLTGENRTFGDCPHPHLPDRLAGGSSSGSAALVAAGVVPFAIGTDTGGSVRVPAAFCGVFGYRGTPGDPLITDAFPLSQSCDTAGWFTANARDMQVALDVLLGASRPLATPPRGAYLQANDLLPSPSVDAACARAAERFASPVDAASRDALLSSWRDAVDAYVTVVMAEAHATHRRWLEPHRPEYDPVIWQRFSDAGRTPPERIAAARAAFARVRATFAEFFRTHDFLVLPCAPLPALTKAECTPEARRAILTFTSPASLGGLPGLAVPVPLAGGLTAGLQILAREPNSAAFRWALARCGSGV